MKKAVCGLCAVALVGSVSAGQVTSVWQGGATATTPLIAANWNDPANWDANGVPNGPDAIADFGTQSGVFYVTSAIPVSVWAQLASNAGGFTFVSEEKFSILNKVDIKPTGGHFYAPVEFQYDGGQTYFSQARFCDEMTAGPAKNTLINGLVFYHLDRFARTPGPVRSEDIDFKVFGFNAHFDIFAPESSTTDVVCTFDQTAGSAILKRVGGSVSTVLSVGTTVSGTGIPEGTYLKRVFPNKEWIELSQPVTADATANELTFAAFAPDLTLKLNYIQSNSANTRYFLRPCKYRQEDDFTVDVAQVGLIAAGTSSDQAMVFDTPHGTRVESPDQTVSYSAAKYDVQYDTTLYPARVVIHNGGTVSRGTALLADCDLLFSRNPGGTMTPGFSRGVVAQLPLKDRNNIPFEESKLTVTGSMTAVIHELKGIWATLGKYGSGTLIVGMTNAAPSTGTIAVREGTFRIADPGEGNIYYCAANDEGPVEIGSLEIAAGATFVVPARGVRLLGSFKAEQGAIIDGEGALILPESVDLATCGAIFRGKARLGFYGIKLVGTGDHSSVPGNPAFWVDCSQTNTMTLVDVNGELGVERINDVRKQSDDDGYNYSTAVGGFLPRLHYDAVSGKHFVYFLGNRTVFKLGDPVGLQDCDTHAWHEPVENIRAVFQVMSQLRDGTNEKNKYGLANMTRGGLFLGACYPATKPGHDNTWGRYSTAYSSPFVQDTWMPAMKNASWFVNGSDNVGLAAGYPYPSYVENGEIQLVPATIGYQRPVGTTGGHSASAYDHNVQYQDQNKNGNKILCELIVYTTDVSEADRKQITAYLMKKWQNAEIYARDFQSNGGSFGTVSGSSRIAIDAAEGDGALVEGLKDSAMLVKTGAGRLRVAAVEGSDATLEVQGGTVEVESKALDRMPVTDGVFAHFDASDSASVVCAEGGSQVTAWKDVGGLRTASLDVSSTTPPTLVAKESLGGKKVVDFGTATSKSGATVDWTTSPALILPEEQRSAKLHTVIALWGSEHGGGSLVGGATGPEMKWSTRYTLARGGDATGNLGASAAATVVDTKMTIPYTCQLPKGVDFRLNGTACNQVETGLSGGFDIVSYAGYETFGMGGLSGIFGSNKNNSNVYYVGGEQFGEYVAFERKLAPADVEAVEAYLRHKWFGAEAEGFDSASFKSLTVAKDATVKVTGGAPVTVAKLGCAGGTVDGEVVLTEDAVLTATVDEDGAVLGATVSAAIDISKGGTVTLEGALDALLPGSYTLLTAGTPIESVDGWFVSVTGTRKRYLYSLSVADGKLMLTVSKPGALLIVR